jgi:uncharacterized protein GlcG (DUF336 family)
MLTVELVAEMVGAAVERARELGIAVSVAVVDAAGLLRQVTRMEDAGWLTPEVALAKARAAVGFRRDTEELEQRFQDRPLAAASLLGVGQGRIAFLKGGVVLRHEGRVVGAIGVSGGTPEQDVACAQAGVERALARWSR